MPCKFGHECTFGPKCRSGSHSSKAYDKLQAKKALIECKNGISCPQEGECPYKHSDKGSLPTSVALVEPVAQAASQVKAQAAANPVPRVAAKLDTASEPTTLVVSTTQDFTALYWKYWQGIWDRKEAFIKKISDENGWRKPINPNWVQVLEKNPNCEVCPACLNTPPNDGLTCVCCHYTTDLIVSEEDCELSEEDCELSEEQQAFLNKQISGVDQLQAFLDEQENFDEFDFENSDNF